MYTWIVCGVLGGLTVAFAPMLIATTIRLLSGYARKYPSFADVVATIILFIVTIVLVAMSFVFAAVYHHLLFGSP